MSLIQLPNLETQGKQNLKFQARNDVLAKWQSQIRLKSEADNVITIYDSIGEDYFSEGVTCKRIAAALRAIGDKDVIVNINSPGGDYFEGIGIYNLLREHPHKITVNVVGLAASAASVIAMAGDEINIGDGAFIMIHNAWSVVAGNARELQSAVALLNAIDNGMINLYAKRTNLSEQQIGEMMDNETWLDSASAIELGFADDEIQKAHISGSPENSQKKALSIIDSVLSEQGITRSQRRDLFNNLFHSTPCAAETVMPCADNITASLQQLIHNFKG